MKPSTCRKLELAGAPVLTPRLLPRGEKLVPRKTHIEEMGRRHEHRVEYTPPKICAREDWTKILGHCNELEGA